MNKHPHISMEPATQLALFLSNRPGALAKVCEELVKAEINIHALSISDTVDHSIVRMVVSDTTKALMLLGEGGMIALEAEVLMIESDNEPGTLATIAERLAKAGVNIEYAYLATSARSNTGLMILRPSNMESALAVLREL
ncbi:MAG TPA: ACT domain-containing protein [Chthoniobacterales bacterium]